MLGMTMSAMAKSSTSSINRVIRGEVDAVPRSLRSPIHPSAAPELIGRRQPQRQQANGAEVATSGRDVVLRHRRLMATEADAQPAALVERSRRLGHPPDHGGHRAAHL